MEDILDVAIAQRIGGADGELIDALCKEITRLRNKAAVCCEHGFIGMDASFIHEYGVGAHPIVTVRFALEDWESRDAFVKHFRCNP